MVLLLCLFFTAAREHYDLVKEGFGGLSDDASMIYITYYDDK